MPRIFTLDIKVAESDIDIQGHVNNTRYVAWMQDVAVAHSAAQGWPMTRYVEEGAGWVVRQHTITYKRPCFLGEIITACTRISSFAPRQSGRKYLFWRAADRVVLAEAETQWVFIDLKTGRPTKVPENLKNAFEIVEDDAEVKRLLEG
jgi:acyl-CoA thioester hydrolase